MNQKLNLKKNERLDDLQFKGLKIFQNKDLYSFTSDSVVLANFLKIKKGEKAVEIGSGSGVISILASRKTNADFIFGFEIQKKLFDLSIKSLALNDISNVKFINDDIRNFKKYFKEETFDVVFSNPPYKKQGSSIVNSNDSKAIARHETFLPLKDFVMVANKLLKFGGRAYFIYDADRSAEMIYELKNMKLEPKRMFYTTNGKGQVVLFVVEAVKGGKCGVKVYENLQTNDLNGNYISDIKNRYYF